MFDYDILRSVKISKNINVILFNNIWFSSSASDYLSQPEKLLIPDEAVATIGNHHRAAYTRRFGFAVWDAAFKVSLKASGWMVFAAAAFLVSVPVFVQAPLVRLLPFLSLVMTLGWVWLGLRLLKRQETQVWGDLLLGFSWSWLAGSIYWGWLRWEPLIHLPVEAIGLPFAFWSLRWGWGKVGNMFYLGSLFGTALTDLYFYLTDLIPYWRQVMRVDPDLATPIFQSALTQVQTPWGITLAVVLIATLFIVGIWSLVKGQLHWWAFSGAVLSTILVDSLFWVAASMV